MAVLSVFSRPPAILALEDGSVFRGWAIGASGKRVGEVVFNTAMTGYQEILTDPSYASQIVTLTYPHIGNTGVNPADEETPRVWAAGLVVRDLTARPSNWRSRESMPEYMRRNDLVGISGIDTRRLTTILRDKGSLSGCLLSGEETTESEALAAARGFPGLVGMDLARLVSRKNPTEWSGGTWHHETESPKRFVAGLRVVAYDFGIKQGILRHLFDRGCSVTVVPAETPAHEVLDRHPHGVFLSNGPGDPEPCGYAITAVRELLGAGIPIFGICLGHQLLGLASGAKTVKMRHGHHGANHPVRDLETGRILVTSQNHGFVVDRHSLPASVKPTHISLFDQSLQGIALAERPAFGFQGHPEACPGPQDASYLFDRFLQMMVSEKAAQRRAEAH